MLSVQVIAALVGLLSIPLWLSMRRKKSLPPGPHGLPLLGSILSLGREPWITFTEWQHQYGPLFYLTIAGMPVLVINTQKVAADILDRRSVISSDRPRNIVSEIITGGMMFILSQPTDLWKRMRRTAHEMLAPDAVKVYQGSQERDAILLASQMLNEPSDFLNQIGRANGSTSMSVVYGTPPQEDVSNADIRQTREFVGRLLETAPPNFLVHFFPSLERLPRFLSPWRRWAEYWFEQHSLLFGRLFGNAADKLTNGNDTPCVITALMGNEGKHEFSRLESSWLAATLLIAGTETMTSQMEWFMLSMITYPDVMRKAQAQLDEVVGSDRIPTLDDWDRLPYLRALVKELMRWRTTGPLGAPHQLSEDDWYEGYFLPKGSLIFPNVWAMHKETEVYGEDVDNLRPERHLTPEGNLKPASVDSEGHFTYGFGRRICVGRHVANRTLFIQMALILWSFNISPGKDADGNTVLPDPDAMIASGVVVRPPPFLCTLTPRFPEVPKIVAQMMDQAIRPHLES
ncbi:cytochrome P450 [Mycena leptocephala]|nr:cytochrome P450 [Mycena leptocephala]